MRIDKGYALPLGARVTVSPAMLVILSDQSDSHPAADRLKEMMGDLIESVAGI